MIYVAAPSQYCSGGPELAHQLCHEINAAGQRSKMCYYSKSQFAKPSEQVRMKYRMYKTEVESCMELIDQKENLLIVPETAIRFAYLCKHCKIAVYWMSVDNYFARLSQEEDKVFRDFFLNKVSLHLVQSFYAYQFCDNELGIAKERIVFVSDYINKEYTKKTDIPEKRNNYICYNPSKGLEAVSKLIRRYPEYNWIPLCGLSDTEMQEYMNKAKIYIDFGNHPGKDRIPREAAVCGCCVITNRKGSAGNDKDVPIPSKYKLENETDFEYIKSLIDDIFENYRQHRTAFEDYRNTIRNEESMFANEVNEFLEVYSRS